MFISSDTPDSFQYAIMERNVKDEIVEFEAVSLLKGKRLLAAWQVIVSFLEGLCEAAILTLFARLALRAVDGTQSGVYVPGVGESGVGWALVVLLLVIATRLALALANNYVANRIQFLLVNSLRQSAVRAYSGSSLRVQMDFDEGALQQLIVTLPSGISVQLSGLILSIGQTTMMVAMLGYSLATDFRLTGALVVVILLATLAFKPLRGVIKRRAARVLSVQRGLSSRTAELGGLRFESQAFGLGPAMTAPILSSIQAESDVSEQLGRLKGSLVPLFTTLTYLAVTLGVFILTRTEATNFERTGPILLVVLRSLSYGVALQQVASGLASLKPSITLFAESLSKLQRGRLTWGTVNFEGFESCQFDDVSFSYGADEILALENASFSLDQGMRVGVVGPSGGGKSTTVRLMLGLLEPSSGGVLVNGRPVHEFDRSEWSKRIGVVPQSAQLLSGTIAENLRLFRLGISDDDLWWALEVADFADEVRALESGVETRIGSGGRALSGGQTQRLSIARAFVARPDFVVMDEPTSSIDVLSEAAVSDAIERLPEDVTMVIISHRMRILRDCDLLIVIEGGSVTDVGPPDEVASRSRYVQSLADGSGSENTF